MGGREEAKKFLDAENPAQALLNSMGIFVRCPLGDRGEVLPAKGAQAALLHHEREGGRPGDVGRGIKNRQVVPHYHCLKSLQPSWRPSLSEAVAAPSPLR